MVVDTGVLLAAIDGRDPAHHASLAVLEGPGTADLIVPTPVLNEVDFFLDKRGLGRAWLAFCEDVSAGRFRLDPVSPDRLLDAAKLQQRYADLQLGFVDAVVFLTCVELGDRTVATLDRRHFSVLRTPDGKALEIVPG